MAATTHHVVLPADLQATFEAVVRTTRDIDAVQDVLLEMVQKGELTQEGHETMTKFPSAELKPVLLYRARKRCVDVIRRSQVARKFVVAMQAQNPLDSCSPFALAAFAELHVATFHYLSRCLQLAMRGNFDSELLGKAGQRVWCLVNGKERDQVLKHHRGVIKLCAEVLDATPRLRRFAGNKSKATRFMARAVRKVGWKLAVMTVTGLSRAA